MLSNGGWGGSSQQWQKEGPPVPRLTAHMSVPELNLVLLFPSSEWWRQKEVLHPRKKAPGLLFWAKVRSELFPGDQEYFILSYMHSINRWSETNLPLVGLHMGCQWCNNGYIGGSMSPWSPSPTTHQLCIKGQATDLNNFLGRCAVGTMLVLRGSTESWWDSTMYTWKCFINTKQMAWISVVYWYLDCHHWLNGEHFPCAFEWDYDPYLCFRALSNWA